VNTADEHETKARSQKDIRDECDATNSLKHAKKQFVLKMQHQAVLKLILLEDKGTIITVKAENIEQTNHNRATKQKTLVALRKVFDKGARTIRVCSNQKPHANLFMVVGAKNIKILLIQQNPEISHHHFSDIQHLLLVP
jgi:hypothetical protein